MTVLCFWLFSSKPEGLWEGWCGITYQVPGTRPALTVALLSWILFLGTAKRMCRVFSPLWITWHSEVWGIRDWVDLIVHFSYIGNSSEGLAALPSKGTSHFQWLTYFSFFLWCEGEQWESTERGQRSNILVRFLCPSGLWSIATKKLSFSAVYLVLKVLSPPCASVPRSCILWK